MVVLSIGSTSTSMHGSRMAGSWYPSGKVILYNIAKRVKAVSGGVDPTIVFKHVTPVADI